MNTPETERAAPPADRPQHRRGCSCLTAALYSLFFLCVLIIGAVFVLQHLARKSAYTGMTPAQVTEFQKWARTPVEIPPHLQSPPPPLPKSFYTERRAFFLDAHLAYQGFANRLGDRRTSLQDQMRNGAPLSNDQLSTVAEVAPQAVPFVERAKLLANQPDYVFNDRRIPGEGVNFLEFRESMKMLELHVLHHVYKTDYATALDTMDTMLKLVRRDPISELIVHMIAQTPVTNSRQTAALIAERTTDTAVLRATLEVLNRNRNDALTPDADFVYMGDYLPERIQQQADGYLTKPVTTTPLSLINIYAEREDYYKWLETHLPASDPRLAQVRVQLKAFAKPAAGNLLGQIYQAISTGPLRPLLKQVQGIPMEFMLIHIRKTVDELRDRNRILAAKYDLARIHIARKLALAESGTSITEAAQFAPAYLEEFPGDPFTSGTLVYAPASDNFFSAGKDAIPYTPDDVYADLPMAAAPAAATTTTASATTQTTTATTATAPPGP